MREAVKASSPPTVSDDAELLWTVKQEQIGRNISYSATISSRMVDGPLVHNDGIVTAIPESGDILNEGAPILQINLKTIVVGQDRIPMYPKVNKDIKVGSPVTSDNRPIMLRSARRIYQRSI